MASLTVSAVTKAFGTTTVLSGVSLQVADGEFLTLLGPSGCGKSTLLRIIAGLEAQDSGTVAIAGACVDDQRPKNRDVAMVFQSYALYPHMTVAANIGVPLRMRRLTPWQRLPLASLFLPGTRAALRDIEAEVARTAKALALGGLLDRKPGQLSGGQRQRVAVGRAMVRRPSVFLMDEPLSNLDAKLRVAMRAEIKDLHRRLGITFIYVTHDQSEAMTLSDRVALMLDGELIQVAPPDAIYANPADRRVAEFIGSPQINMLEAAVRGPDMVEAGGALLRVGAPAGDGLALVLGIRPETLQPVDQPRQNAFTGSVRLVEHMGPDFFVHVQLPGEAAALVARLPAEGQARPQPGQAMHLAVDPARILLFDPGGKRLRARATAPDLLRVAR